MDLLRFRVGFVNKTQGIEAKVKPFCKISHDFSAHFFQYRGTVIMFHIIAHVIIIRLQDLDFIKFGRHLTNGHYFAIFANNRNVQI